MSTLRPQLVRADTIDLQAQNAPSAKDHTRQRTHPTPLGAGPAAPHQDRALRIAEQETLHEQKYIPRVSEDHLHGDYPEEPDFYDDHHDMIDAVPAEHNVQPNGQPNGEQCQRSNAHDPGVDDQTDDDSLDDDLIDKISSSPSIDDGKYPLPIIWPLRKDSIDAGNSHCPVSSPFRGARDSSSPFTSTPDYFPLSVRNEEDQEPCIHDQWGRVRLDQENLTDVSPPDSRDPPLSRAEHLEHNVNHFRLHENWYESDSHQDCDVHDIGRFLLPVDDPLLANAFDDRSWGEIEEDSHVDDDDSDWEDEEENVLCRRDSSSDDENEDSHFTHDPRFLDSGWGGECLRETEDIDFEFVYALHTFVATVEGQANATKGDTMVLLDDSNSYWWLVRVVKDGSIGYLPAEHIETPTERLARLNKHRNIDLSATMLGDNPEKSKNPLKKAMRRRNAKTVQFAAPQYFEPSDFEYSDDEEGQEDLTEQIENAPDSEHEEALQEPSVEDGATSSTSGSSQQAASAVNRIRKVESNDSVSGHQQSSPDTAASDEAFPNERRDESNVRSRVGIVRNTDSFFRDDGVETKKISLTPRLLRGDSDLNANKGQIDARQGPNLDTFDKIVAQETDRSREDKKKKEKKGMFGLFKRKEKRSRALESEVEENEKSSEDSPRPSPQSRESLEPQDFKSVKPEQAPARQPSKLQKAPPTGVTPKVSRLQESLRQQQPSPVSSTDSGKALQGQNKTSSSLRPGPSEQPHASKGSDVSQERLRNAIQEQPTSSPTEKKSIFSPLANPIQTSPSTAPGPVDQEPTLKSAYAKQFKHRFGIDESDSSRHSTSTAEPRHYGSLSPLAPETASSDQERLSDSPIHVSPVEEANNPFDHPKSQPPGLVIDTSSASEPPRSISAQSPSQASSPSLVDANTANAVDQSLDQPTTSPPTQVHTPSTTRSTPPWSDASLRTYMDNDDDIRDLLIIVQDKSNVTPAGPDHPITANLFGAEKGRLAEMQSNLDSLLTGWLARKNGVHLPT